MVSKNPEFGPINKLIQNLERENRPLAKWAAASLNEIYLHEEFSLARVKGSHDPNLKYTPRGVRLIALHEGRFMGLGIVLSSKVKDLGIELRREVDELPNAGPLDANTNDVVTRLLIDKKKQTVAALEIGTSVKDNSKVVQVLYPKLLRFFARDLFASLGINLNELQTRQAASGIAIRFIKSVPFQSSEPRILTPENI